jgi:hypothetical protein
LVGKQGHGKSALLEALIGQPFNVLQKEREKDILYDPCLRKNVKKCRNIPIRNVLQYIVIIIKIMKSMWRF